VVYCRQALLAWARRAEWVAYAVCGWAFLFAALSFFWAAGGRTGLQPLEQEAASSGPVWLAINLSIGVLKALAGLMAVALVRSKGQRMYHVRWDPWRVVRGVLLVATAWFIGHRDVEGTAD